MEVTCACGSKTAACPECGRRYRLGTVSRCLLPSCRAVNAPVDCIGCGRVVSADLDGVLDFEMKLVPWQ